MGDITGTKVKKTEMPGHYGFAVFTATVASASDTIDLSSYFSEILFVAVEIETGIGTNFKTIMPTFSGTTVTVVSKNASGATATSFGDIRLLVAGTYN